MKNHLKFERLLETYLAFVQEDLNLFLFLCNLVERKLFQKNFLFNKLQIQDKKFNDINKINFSEHHYNHASSAFYPSPFEEAIVLTLDGVGEWATTTVTKEKGNQQMLKEIYFPHSIGLLYSAFTYYTG